MRNHDIYFKVAAFLLIVVIQSTLILGFSAQTFSCLQAVQNITIPSNANSVLVDIKGASSGNSGGLGTPGYGARIQATISVVSGSILYIYVGCKGSGSTAFNSVNPVIGGWNGGGAGRGSGNGGGGASDFRIGGTTLAQRVMVAGGGGGYYNNGCGTQKGGNAGQIGAAGTNSAGCANTLGGGGGTASSGGSAGSGGAGNAPMTGGFGYGGNGCTGGGGNCNCGGGGGGYYGGKENR